MERLLSVGFLVVAILPAAGIITLAAIIMALI